MTELENRLMEAAVLLYSHDMIGVSELAEIGEHIKAGYYLSAAGEVVEEENSQQEEQRGQE